MASIARKGFTAEQYRPFERRRLLALRAEGLDLTDQGEQHILPGGMTQEQAKMAAEMLDSIFSEAQRRLEIARAIYLVEIDAFERCAKLADESAPELAKQIRALKGAPA